MIPEQVVDGLQPGRGVGAPIAAELPGPAVVGGIGGTYQIVVAAGLAMFAAANGVVDQIVFENLAAGGDVVTDVIGQQVQVVETPPHPAVDLHDAQGADG